MFGSSRPLWLRAILYGAFLIICLGLAVRLPFINNLIGRTGGASAISILVLAIAIWVIFASSRYAIQDTMERAIIERVQQELDANNNQVPLSEVDRYLVGRIRELPFSASMIRRRLLLLTHGLKKGQKDFVQFLVSCQSALDTTRHDLLYGPIRALVWSLPALGFVGTALEMSYAVGGLGVAVGSTTNYSDLRNFLVQRVIPPLAGAFDITLFALGGSVICYIILVFVYNRGQKILLEADTVTLKLLAVNTPLSVFDDASETLDGEIDVLTREVAKCNEILISSNNALNQLSSNGGIKQVVPLLNSMNRQLQGIRDGLERDLIIHRSSSPNRSDVTQYE